MVSHTATPDGTFTDVDRFDLPGGQVLITDRYTVEVDTDPRSCVLTRAMAGSHAVLGATGQFAGASGDGTFTAAGTIVTGRDAAGGCLGLDSDLVAVREVVHGAGTTTIG